MKRDPVKDLNVFRGKAFRGEWPTVPEMLEMTVEKYGRKKGFTAFEPDYLSLTYAEIGSVTDEIAGYLLSSGIVKGDRVGLAGKNSPEWTIAYLSVLKLGAVIVPVDYQLPSEDIGKLFSHAAVKAVFVDEEKFEDIPAAGLNLSLKISLSKNRPNYLLNLKSGGREVSAPPSENDICAILYTSGTMGNPKGVVLSHRNFTSDVYLAQAHLKLYSSDVFYALLPLHHIYTMTAVFLESVCVGAEIVYGKRIVTKNILEELKKGKVTMFLGVPLLFNKIIKAVMKGIKEKGPFANAVVGGMMAFSGFMKKTLNINPGKFLFRSILKKISFERIRVCISGGGPLPPETFRKFNQLGIDFIQGYGLTETAPILTLNPVEHYKETSVGKVLPAVDLKIAEPDKDGIGEIIVKGPMVMNGYYMNDEETKKIFSGDGYLKTGDVGYLDGENYVYLTGRKKNIIVTEGGKNVSPEEIEYGFEIYEEIEQIMVRGYLKNAETKTEDIMAYVFPCREYFESEFKKTDSAWDDAFVASRIGSVVAEVNNALPAYKKVKRFEVLKEPMEMTTTKKIKRFKIQ